MTPTREALLITSERYSDDRLSRLRGTVADGSQLSEVLSQPEIGKYVVEHFHDGPYYEIGERIGTFLRNRSPTNHLLLYLSCHGVKDDRGELHFASANTNIDALEDTAISACSPA